MKPRIFAPILAAVMIWAYPAWSSAAALDAISNRDAVAGLKEALVKGSQAAVASLGRRDGFFGNPQVKIPLPESLRRAEGLMRAVGMGKYADELVLTMNRAAEEAVPQATKLLLDAVKKMTVTDAKAILTGGDDAATQYFRRTTSAQLHDRFLPIVRKATARVQLAEKYNEYAGKAARFGLLSKQDANLDEYVTGKALDGLFLTMADEEKKLRQDPLGAGSSIIRKVFGALR
ncbi:MAG TPA: DUF4197 domain-containing protein [Burkholderiales bacterium]|nr:DUF4197 domain-containing protein [Burkholderiales bacterium]